MVIDRIISKTIIKGERMKDTGLIFALWDSCAQECLTEFDIQADKKRESLAETERVNTQETEKEAFRLAESMLDPNEIIRLKEKAVQDVIAATPSLAGNKALIQRAYESLVLEVK